MEATSIPSKRIAGLVFVPLVLSLAAVLIPSRQAAAAHSDCTLTVSGPFFYAGLVFPVIEVECDSVKRSIRIDAALDMDGTEVATSSRICRRASSCVTGLASDGIFTTDVPGDQLWCGRGSAAIRTQGPPHFLPEVGSCESEDF